jgi:hypothetical protein
MAEAKCACSQRTSSSDEFLSYKTESNCVNCVILKEELLSVSLEVKSTNHIIALLQEDINRLRREVGEDNILGNVNVDRGYEEGLLSVVVNKNRKKSNTNLSKQSFVSTKLTPPSIETENRFEILHNLKVDESQDASTRKNFTTQGFNNNNGVHKQQGHVKNSSEGIPVIINRQTPMETKKKTDPTLRHNERTHHNHQRRLVIIGDSYARGCAANMKHILKDDFLVYGVVKPGMGAETLSVSAKQDIEQLTRRDAVVFWGGSNDVGKNNSKYGLRHIVDFVTANNHTNIFLVSVPHRHDLCDWSCVNREVQSFNRKLEKYMKCFKHVKVVNVDRKRENFTTHGLHMNNMGKEKVSLLITNAINTLFQKQISDSIKLSWKTEGEKDVGVPLHRDSITVQEELRTDATNSKEGTPHVMENEVLRKEPGVFTSIRVHPENREISAMDSNRQEHKVVRASIRQKKPPITRKEDFLW